VDYGHRQYFPHNSCPTTDVKQRFVRQARVSSLLYTCAVCPCEGAAEPLDLSCGALAETPSASLPIHMQEFF
jgi:hypothetical protein